MPILRHLTAIALVSIAALPAPALAAAPAGSPSQHDLRAALHHAVTAGAPGIVAYAGGRTASAGVADLHSERPLRATDRVRIGSVTKSFTAAVALQLVGEGRLGLQDTVQQRLPGVLPYGDRVTLRQLLNHTSGIPDDVSVPLREIFGGRQRAWTPARTLALVRDKPQRFPAGTGWAYSNTDYVLVGLMIERATGDSLGRELQRRVVQPLHLRHTSFPLAGTRLGSGAARGYSLDLDARGRPLDGPLRDVTAYAPSFAWAAGNGVSTVGDVARFYHGLLDGELLAPQLLREALTTVDTGTPGRRYGLGLNVRDSPFGTLVGHDGDLPGFSVQALSRPDGTHQAVVAVNEKFAPARVDDAVDGAMDAAVRAAFRTH